MLRRKCVWLIVVRLMFGLKFGSRESTSGAGLNQNLIFFQIF